jgi:dephospho-CoA kinase
MRVIGVIGKNGSGKDEVLKYLKDKHNVPFLSTGDIVREIARPGGTCAQPDEPAGDLRFVLPETRKGLLRKDVG